MIQPLAADVDASKGWGMTGTIAGAFANPTENETMSRPRKPRAGSALRRRLARFAVVAALATVGTVVAVSPAYAVGGCSNSHPALGACVDYQPGASSVRADFYLNHPPDLSRTYYRVLINLNGGWHAKTGKVRFGGTGRYCCWWQPTQHTNP